MGQTIERKLAAIMFTDIVGYTASMSKSESKTLDLLDKKRSILSPLLKQHKGTFVKEIGDGTLTYFDSAVNAASCAIKLQEQTYDDQNMNIRAGIHIGDIVFKDGDVFGDGVNIAARLESIAPSGGVCVSKNVYDELINQDDFEGIELGLQSLKGVGRLVEVFGLKGNKLNEPNPDEYTENQIKIHSDDEVPSIAIIPFNNKGADEDIFYAYGISADLISDCSAAGLIRVASLKDVENLDYNSMDTSELATKLFTRYISTGTLWKMKDVFQLSIEFYDTKDKKVVWSDRWQEKWDNLPTIKINLSDGLLKALDTTSKVENKAETTNPEAYELYLKAKNKYEKRKNTDDTEIARGLLNKAIELDDNLLSAKDLLGTSYTDMGDYDEAMEIFILTLKQAEELGDKSEMGNSLHSIGMVHFHKGDYDKALDYYTRSLAIFEELGDKYRVGYSLNNIGILHSNEGDYDKTLDCYARSLAISEEIGDKLGMGTLLNNIGILHFNKGDRDKALEYFGRSLAIREEIGDKYGMGTLLTSIGIVHSNKGDYDKALDYYARSLAISEEIGDKEGMGYSLHSIGMVHFHKGDYDNALDYYARSLAISEEIDDKYGMGGCLNSIGNVHSNKGDYDNALDCYARSLAIREKLGSKREMGYNLNSIGIVHSRKGDYDKALDCYARSLAIREELGDKIGMGYNLWNIGMVHFNKGDYEKAEEHLEKSLNIQKEITYNEEENIKLGTTTYLYLSYTHLGKDYDEKEIHSLIKDAENIGYELNFRLYQLLDDTTYLETAYNQFQEKASKMDKELAAKFLGCPIPKAIVEEYNKVFK